MAEKKSDFALLAQEIMHPTNPLPKPEKRDMLECLTDGCRVVFYLVIDNRTGCPCCGRHGE